MTAKKCVLSDERLAELINSLRLLNTLMQKHGYMFMLDPNISYNRIVVIKVALNNYTETKVFHGNYSGAKNWFRGALDIAKLL